MTGLVAASTVVPATGEYGRIYDTANALLTSLLASFAAATVEPPALQYVSVGETAYDFGGEFLVVEALQFHPGPPGITVQEALSAGSQYSLDCLVHCIRTVPTLDDQGRPPTPTELAASAQLLLRDWWIVHRSIIDNTLAAISGTGELVGAPYRSASMRQMDAYGPSGGVGGLVASVDVELV